MGYWAGLLSGLGDAHEKHNKTLLDQEMERRKQLIATHKMIFEHPDVTPEARDIAVTKMFGLQTLGPYDRVDKKKDLSNLDYVTKGVQPKPGQSWKQPQNTAEISGAPIPARLYGEGVNTPEAVLRPEDMAEDIGRPRQGMSNTVQAMPIPEPPQDYTRSAFYSPDEQAAQAASVYRRRLQTQQEVERPFKEEEAARQHANRLEEIKATGQAGVERAKAGIRPRPVAGTVSGEELMTRLGGAPLPGFPAPEPGKHYRYSVWPNGEVAEYGGADYSPPVVTVSGPGGQPVYEDRSKAIGKPATGIVGEPTVLVMEGNTPVYRRRSDAIGKPGVRTVFDIHGNPTTGGAEGVSLTPPIPVAASVGDQIYGLKTSVDALSDLQPLLKGTLGPALGKVKLFEINKLGGLGATAAEMNLASLLQRAITQQAFSNGGKQLTITELQQFTSMLPKMDDTVLNAAIKARNAIAFLERSLRTRIDTLSPVQRGLLGPSYSKYGGGGAGAAKVPGPGPKVGDTKTFPNGNKARWDGNGWELIQ